MGLNYNDAMQQDRLNGFIQRFSLACTIFTQMGQGVEENFLFHSCPKSQLSFGSNKQ